MTEMERKLKLTRFMREENMRNQIRVKNREEILYGSGKPYLTEEDVPPVYDGHLEEFRNIKSQNPKNRSAFWLRTFVALFLFMYVLYLDKTDSQVFEVKARNQIITCLNWSAEGKLIDFMSHFPYTLSDTPDTD